MKPNAQQIFNAALAALNTRDFQKAEAGFRRVVALAPTHVPALNLLTVVLMSLGRFREAEPFIAKAVELNQASDVSFYNYGLIARKLNKQQLAYEQFTKALKINAAVADTWNNRGAVCNELNRYKTALTDFGKAIELNPNHAEAYTNRAKSLSHFGRYDEAFADYDKALSIRPDLTEAWLGRGNVFHDLKRYDEALAAYDKALSIKPDCEFLYGTYLQTKMRICDWGGFAENLARYEAGIAAGKKITAPFAALGLVDSPELHLRVAGIYAEAKYPRSSALGDIVKSKPNDKIRIGYFSGDFHNHATAFLMAELFEVHDKSKFELYGFSFGPNAGDEMRERVAAGFDKFIDVTEKGDREIARLSRDLGIDIAVDLKGYTQDARTGIFAECCAPIQVSYIGYPGTMGVDYIDYIIADKIVIPEDGKAYFTEKVVCLPHSYQVNDSKREISERVFGKQELGLPEEGFVYCCFNNNYKILPATFESWMRILGAVEGSVLWLFEDNAMAAGNLRKEAELRGVDGRRLVFASRMKRGEHLARHRLADLFVDTLPYNAHTTASDALWAGLPVLTCAGRSFASRVAASLLNAVDLRELIAQSVEEYEALAIELARDRERLQNMKRKLDANRMTAPLFDAALFARHLEAAYEAMYWRYRAGLPPDHIAIQASDGAGAP